MTTHEGRTPSAWGVCPDCGAVAPNRAGHQSWHDDLAARVAALEQLADPAPAALPDDGGI